VGEVTGDGRVLAVDSRDGSVPFDLPLSLVLGKMPQKEFRFSTPNRTLLPISFPDDVSLDMALERVLRLLDVGSKRFLTNKVDRSVTGLIAQQQCVGPLHSPLSDVAVCALRSGQILPYTT
jgi:phosphoribosylformylglycinamidine synthase